MNPATRVGNVVIWQGGYVRKLWWRERFLLWFAKRLNASVNLPQRQVEKVAL